MNIKFARFVFIQIVHALISEIYTYLKLWVEEEQDNFKRVKIQ